MLKYSSLRWMAKLKITESFHVLSRLPKYVFDYLTVHRNKLMKATNFRISLRQAVAFIFGMYLCERRMSVAK